MPPAGRASTMGVNVREEEVNGMAHLFGFLRISAEWVAARMNVKSERGATAVEYGLMVALIAAVIIAAVVFLGQQTSSTFDCTAQSVQTRSSACP